MFFSDFLYIFANIRIFIVELKFRYMGKIKKILKEADEKCPYPYTQLDCSFEDYAGQVGAVSLEGFMQKMNEKYGI